MALSPMLSSPLKQTDEIDWITPLKSYIRDNYDDDPERYAEECGMLNRLRQDMRGAAKDSASGRDLLYRYYGQLEFLDLRFPVDENHVKIHFYWYDAFTHQKTGQYSLAFEKASIIFNMSAVLSCHAANQNRHEDVGLKTSYHSFQASAGMFTYINENFLHAPSSDLHRETVKSLIHIMLAQAQEVFLEKQIADDKKVGLLAKLASQAAYLYGQALEGVQECVNKSIFERIWLSMVQVKNAHMASVAQYYQALADNDANSHGIAISRLQVAEGHAKDANRIANSFPNSVPANSNLTSEVGGLLSDITRKHLSNIQERLVEFSKDNDFIYHQPVPSEAALQPIPKLPAAKPIPVSDLYQGQDIQRIIGPDIFQRIVPMAVTESASLYDEEKAKLVRAEGERVEVANDEMAASFDYLKLPSSLDVLKGVRDPEVQVDPDFRAWCGELSGHSPFSEVFDELRTDKSAIQNLLDSATKSLDMEESVCEKMRSKYGDEWSQQPSSRLTATLRSDIRNYRGAIDEASSSDSQLYGTFRQFDTDFEEMRSAGESDEADVLYQRALIKAGAGRGKGGVSSPQDGNLLDDDFDGGPSVAEQIANVEELMKKLKLVKKEREQVLKDLKDKAHNDDISQVLVLNKKSMGGHDNQIFKAELEKFRPHQTRVSQAIHKQSTLLKELTRTFDTLLQDRRVRSEQSKYEAFSRQRSSVLNKYKKVYEAFTDLVTGLMRAQSFYNEMKETVESLSKNVETFVNNRRNEGGQLLSSIEAAKSSGNNGLVDWERERLKELMERMSVEPNAQSSRKSPALSVSYSAAPSRPAYPSTSSQQASTQYTGTSSNYSIPQIQQPYQSQYQPGTSATGPPRDFSYNPTQYGPVSPQPGQQAPPHSQAAYFSPPPVSTAHHSHPSFNSPQYLQQQGQPQRHSQPGYGQTQMPPGWQPPPPPPGPPPQQQDMNFGVSNQGNYPSGPGGWAQSGQRQSQNGPTGTRNDPWEGLNQWK